MRRGLVMKLRASAAAAKRYVKSAYPGAFYDGKHIKTGVGEIIIGSGYEDAAWQEAARWVRERSKR